MSKVKRPESWECPQCKGAGGYETTLRDLAGRRRNGLGIDAYVQCMHPCCVNGRIYRSDWEEYEKRHSGWGEPVKEKKNGYRDR